MFRKNLVPVWIGILCIASAFLVGQEPWGPSGGTAPVAKTGQTTSYATGDDGDLEKGVVWPIPRFTDNGDGTVTDNLTWLIWTQNADCHGESVQWWDALEYCNTLADGTCGLSDASSAGDWRLPNIFELESLLDMENSLPALPTGHPFTLTPGTYNCPYWSSTDDAATSYFDAWAVNFCIGYYGRVFTIYRTDGLEVWCVRGGQ